MKKIISVFTLALLFVGSANAQLVPELKGKAVQLGEEVLTMDNLTTGENNWYAISQKRGNDGYFWDKGAGEKLYKSNGTSVLGGSKMPASSVAQYIVRFLSTPKEGYYTIQFGTGNYLGKSGDGNNSGIFSAASIDNADPVRMYTIKTTPEGGGEAVDNPGHWGINLTTNDARVDNNGSGNTLSPWESGTINYIDGNNDHRIWKIDFVEATPQEIALTEVVAIFAKYNAYTESLTIGENNEPGTYNKEAVEAFKAALDAVNNLESPDVEINKMTAEEILALGENIKTTYDAAVATKVPYAVAVKDGYYLINSAMKFTEKTEDTVDPETNETIPGKDVDVVKGMYGEKTTSGLNAGWKTAEKTAPFLWKVTAKGDKLYELMNVATDGKFTNTVSNLSLESDSLMVFDINKNEGDTKTYNIRLKNDAERGQSYLHANNHASGKGKGDKLVKWYQTDGAGASEWILVPVSDEEAKKMIEDYAPIKEEANRLINTKKIIATVTPQLAIAEDNSVKLYKDIKLITNVSQLSSPHSQSDEGTFEGMLDGNIDGTGKEANDYSWYWHSSWASEVAPGTHYFQVEMPTDAPAEVAFEMTRRPVTNDHPTAWSVYGTNENNLETAKDKCTLLAQVQTPFTSNNETVTSSVFKTQNYKYLRFYVDNTHCPDKDHSRGYFHVAEFQLYKGETIVNPTSQAIAMGKVFTDMQTALANAKAEGDNITVDTYTALKNAYDAFKAMFVNPDTLRSKLENMKGLDKMIVIGNNPGQWKNNNEASSASELYNAATAYDKAGKYTLAQSQKYVTDLDAKMEAILAAANKVETGKWYTLQFPTEEMYNTNGWNKDGAKENVKNEVTIWPALFGKHIAPATLKPLVEGQDANSTAREFEKIYAEDVAMGQPLYYLDDTDIADDDLKMFRFVAVGDTAYLIQNKGTGLYLRATSASSAVTLSIIPSVWTSKAMGFGKVMVSGKNPLTGENQNHLHAQRNGNSLVTWEANAANSNTGFLIAEAEAVASDYDGSEFNMSILPGKVNNFCFPMSVTGVEEDLYGVQIEGTEITLEKLADNTAKAGEPFIYIEGDVNSYDKNAKKVSVKFKHGTEVVREPLTVGKHVGLFAQATVKAGNVITEDNKLTRAWKSETNVPAFSSYIHAEIAADQTVNFKIGENVFNSIQETVAKAVKGGDIYTIDGKYVGKGNLKSKLNKGIYIINGVKVIVK
ncbi:MAG: hypothetical protein SPF56_08085 [Bacteroidaceae bacterium]|nr:hypothetical protein [Bacteroidaceae bacterium]